MGKVEEGECFCNRAFVSNVSDAGKLLFVCSTELSFASENFSNYVTAVVSVLVRKVNYDGVCRARCVEFLRERSRNRNNWKTSSTFQIVTSQRHIPHSTSWAATVIFFLFFATAPHSKRFFSHGRRVSLPLFYL